MSRLMLMLALMLSSSVLAAQQNIRQVDFKNFTYPLSGRLLGHGSLEWLDTPQHPATNKKTIHLAKGSQLTEFLGEYEGFTFESVSYGDAIGDGKEEATVVLMYHTGGTQTTHYVYVYGLGEHGPKLLAYCHTGSRADFGLYSVYARDSLLVFELLDPAREGPGMCCSSGVVISSYKWQDGVFKLAGPIKRRTLPPQQEHPGS